MHQSFRELGVSSPVVDALAARSIHTPFRIQALVLEDALGGLDILARAPTGSGKTLAAFLWCLDRLMSEPVPADPLRRLRVLYISPLKALTYDVERNLREIGRASCRERV